MGGTGEGRGMAGRRGVGLRVGEWGFGSVGRPFGRWDKKKKEHWYTSICIIYIYMYFEIYTIYLSIVLLYKQTKQNKVGIKGRGGAEAHGKQTPTRAVREQ